MKAFCELELPAHEASGKEVCLCGMIVLEDVCDEENYLLRKAPRVDGIPADLIQASGLNAVEALYRLTVGDSLLFILP